ncbi:hypothetical protein GCM10023238_35820 [Streptomyces heliomycini]
MTLAAGVVAWLQTRRGSQTVTITKPDGTQVVVTSQGVRGPHAGEQRRAGAGGGAGPGGAGAQPSGPEKPLSRDGEMGGSRRT